MGWWKGLVAGCVLVWKSVFCLSKEEGKECGCREEERSDCGSLCEVYR